MLLAERVIFGITEWSFYELSFVRYSCVTGFNLAYVINFNICDSQLKLLRILQNTMFLLGIFIIPL